MENPLSSSDLPEPDVRWVAREREKLKPGDMAIVKEILVWCIVPTLEDDDNQVFMPAPYQPAYYIAASRGTVRRNRDTSNIIQRGMSVVFLSSKEKNSGAMEIRILFEGKVWNTFTLETPESYLVKIVPEINGETQDKKGL